MTSDAVSFDSPKRTCLHRDMGGRERVIARTEKFSTQMGVGEAFPPPQRGEGLAGRKEDRPGTQHTYCRTQQTGSYRTCRSGLRSVWGAGASTGPTLGHSVVPAQAEKGLGRLENELRPSGGRMRSGPGLAPAGPGRPSPARAPCGPVWHMASTAPRPTASGWGTYPGATVRPSSRLTAKRQPQVSPGASTSPVGSPAWGSGEPGEGGRARDLGPHPLHVSSLAWKRLCR